MAQVKLSADQMKKIAEVDRFDREQAFEAGFAKIASELGLNEQEFKNFYQIGVNVLQSQARSK